MPEGQKRVYSLYEVIFRRDGQRRSTIVNNKTEANIVRQNLAYNKRKFLGIRPVTLVEA